MVNRHHFFKNSYISQLSLKKVQKSQILCKISKVKIDPLIHSISNVSEDWHWPGCVPWTSRSHWMEKTGISFKVLFVSQKSTKKIHAKSAHRRIPFQMSQKVDIALDNGQWGHIFRCNELVPVGGKREDYHLPPPSNNWLSANHLQSQHQQWSNTSHPNNNQMISYTSPNKRISHSNNDQKLLDPVQTNKQFSDPYLRRKTAIVPSFPLGITLQVPRVLPSCEIGNKPFQTPQLYNSNSCLVVSSSWNLWFWFKIGDFKLLALMSRWITYLFVGPVKFLRTGLFGRRSWN